MCLQISTDCYKGPHGPIESWGVSAVTDMSRLLHDADAKENKFDEDSLDDMKRVFASVSSFNGDISKWDVSRVTNMEGMFNFASSFNGDISKWDVSRVTDMEEMFNDASSFAQTLCGAWLTSTAKNDGMFDGSSGRICRTSASTPTPTCNSKTNLINPLG